MRFRINHLISNTINLIREDFRAHGITLEIQMEDDSTLNGDRGEFAQALLNILTNAKEIFLDRRISSPKISIAVRAEKGNAVVTIADNAGGIPEDILGRICQPYFTTKQPSRMRETRLYISKTIIEEKMNGKLTAYNTIDGAEFRVEVRHVRYETLPSSPF